MNTGVFIERRLVTIQVQYAVPRLYCTNNGEKTELPESLKISIDPGSLNAVPLKTIMVFPDENSRLKLNLNYQFFYFVFPNHGSVNIFRKKYYKLVVG